MFAHAERGEINYSTNPTFKEKSTLTQGSTTDDSYFASRGRIKNIHKSNFFRSNRAFKNIVYISKIGIYDKNKNLIAVASLANPVKKTELTDFSFKMRIDF